MSRMVPKWFWYVSVAWLVVRSGLFLQFFTSRPDVVRYLKLGALILDVSVVVGLVMIGANVYVRWKRTRSTSNNGFRREQIFEPIVVSLPTTGFKPVTSRPCPHCGTNMNAGDRVCLYCHTPSEPWYQQQGKWWQHTAKGDVWLDETTGQWRHPEQV